MDPVAISVWLVDITVHHHTDPEAISVWLADMTTHHHI
jgi:hypothetical protein